MADSEPPTITRRALVGAAWAAPVIVAAVATPLAAASPARPTLSATFVGPSEDQGGGTFYQVSILNESPYSIEPADLTVFIPVSGRGWTWQGFGGSGWNYAPGGTGPTSFTFQYEGTVQPGGSAAVLYFIVSSNDRSASPTPTVQLTAMARDLDSSTLTLPVPY